MAAPAPSPGTRVRLVQLERRPELNGQEGVVAPRARWPPGRRVAVELDSGGTVSVSAERLEACGAEVGGGYGAGSADAEMDGSAGSGGRSAAASAAASDDDDRDGEVSEGEGEGEGDGGGGITLITEGMLASEESLRAIWADLSHNYYATHSWSPLFYIGLAYNGFVSVAHEIPAREEGGPAAAILLPEIQRQYGVLDFAKLHAGKKVRKRARSGGYLLGVNQGMEDVFAGVQRRHDNNWLCHSYRELWRALNGAGPVPVRANGGASRFHAVTVELLTPGGEVVAGEVGYVLGSTYTSLTGYFSTEGREGGGRDAAEPGAAAEGAPPAAERADGAGGSARLKYSSAGKIQLVALGRLLERCGVRFWNLGHPPRPPTPENPKGSMLYKNEIGGETLSRADFLERWIAARDIPIDGHTLPSGQFSATELIDCVGA